jgi:hypothetical protein
MDKLAMTDSDVIPLRVAVYAMDKLAITGTEAGISTEVDTLAQGRTR